MVATFARGYDARGQCGRCGQNVKLRDLIPDGRNPELLVERRCYDPPYPHESLPPVDDPVALERPAPDNDRIATELRFPNYDVDANVVNGTFQLNFILGNPVVT
jgi:hypothetical protein